MFKKYPFVKQEGSKDCGVASLLMIIKYYKGYISLEQLRSKTKTNKNGVTAYHLIEASKELGFDAKGIKCKFKDINQNNLILPCIAYVTLNKTYQHFIVIYEINFKKQYLLVGDPASKIKKINFKEFNEIWNNIFITLIPIKKIPVYKNKITLISFLSYLLNNNKKLLKSIIILSIIITIFSIATSFFFKYMVDSVINDNSNEKLGFIFFIFFTLYFLKIISNFFRNKLLIYINQKIDLTLIKYTFKQIISLPYHYYCNRTTGEIIERINDLNLVRDMISKVALSLFVDLPITLVAFIFLYLINHTLFGIAFVILLLYVINILIFKPLFYKYINKCQEKKALVTSYMVESISGFETVKGLNIEQNVIEQLERKHINLLNDLFKFDNYYNNQYLIKEFIHNIGFITIIYLGCILVIKKELTIGGLLTFNALLAYFLEPIRHITDLDTEIKEAKNALKRILELFYSPINKGIINQELDGDININHLNFTYNDRDNILSNICLDIKKGQKVMITGNSGSGKSTLLKLIKGYFEVKNGMIKINQIDINDYKNESFLNKINYITQKETLFTDTLYNNLTVYNNCNNNKILEISKMCYVDEIIKNNNLGYNLLIEENGFNISGGEKQRIVLARTLLKSFNILLIDEGLNQIDINLERKILKNVFSKFEKQTIIIVSHRLENLDLFDKLVEFNNGKIKKVVCKNE